MSVITNKQIKGNTVFERETGEEKEVFVVARDYGTAKLYAQLKHIKKPIFRYVAHESVLHGRDNIEIHFVTTCRDHERYYQIREVAKWLESKNRAIIKEVDW